MIGYFSFLCSSGFSQHYAQIIFVTYVFVRTCWSVCCNIGWTLWLMYNLDTRGIMSASMRRPWERKHLKTALHMKETAGSKKGSCQVEGKRWRLICDELGQQVWSCWVDDIYSVAGAFIFSILFFNESEEGWKKPSSLYCSHRSTWLIVSICSLTIYSAACWASRIPPKCLKSTTKRAAVTSWLGHLSIHRILDLYC